MMREGLRGFLRRLAVVVALLALAAAAAAAWGQSNRYPRGGGGALVLPNVGTPGTYTWPMGSITTDAQGRVTDAHASGRLVNTTTPVTGGGSLAADLTIACPSCVTTARAVNTTTPLGGGATLAGDLTLTCSTCVTASTLTTNRIPIVASTQGLTDNAGLTWSATGPTLTLAGLFKPYRIAGGSSAPAAAPGAGSQLGTGPTCTVVGNDLDGTITLTTGTSPAAMTAGSFNTLCTISFANSYSGGPRVLVVPSNPAAITVESGSGVVAYVDPTSTLTTSFPVRIVSNTGPTLPASTALIYTYLVLQ